MDARKIESKRGTPTLEQVENVARERTATTARRRMAAIG